LASGRQVGNHGWRSAGQAGEAGPAAANGFERTSRDGHLVTDISAVPVSRPLWRRLLRPVLVVMVLGLVFGWLLPQFIDYQEVWQTLRQLDGWEVLVLLGLGLARVPTEALMYRAFLPGLGLRLGSQAYLSSNLAAQLLPPPSASIVQYGYFHGAGYPSDAAGLAALGSFVFPTIGPVTAPTVRARAPAADR
jgi:hypothetical protein